MSKLLKHFLNIVPPSKVVFDSDPGNLHKPIIVFVHGIAASSRTWSELLTQIDQARYRLITIDLMGYGEAEVPKRGCQYTVDDFTHSLRKTIHYLHLTKKFTLVGHSMGSIIVAHYVSKYPARIKSEYLLSLPFYPQEDTLHNTLSRYQTALYIKAYETLIDNKNFTIDTAQRVRRLLQIDDGIDITQKNWDAFRLSLQNTIIKQNVYRDIQKTRGLVHIIFGTLDEFLVPENMKKLQQLKNVQMTKIIAVDHQVKMRYAKEVAKQLNAID